MSNKFCTNVRAGADSASYRAGATRTNLAVLNKTASDIWTRDSCGYGIAGALSEPVTIGWLDKGRTVLCFINSVPSHARWEESQSGLFFRTGYAFRVLTPELVVKSATSEAACEGGLLAICRVGCVIAQRSYKDRRGYVGGWQYTADGWRAMDATEVETFGVTPEEVL